MLLSIVPSRVIHAVAGVRISLLFQAEEHPIVHVDHNGSTRSSIDAHLNCFHLLRIVTDAAVNTGVQISLWAPALVFLGLYPKVQLLDHREIPGLTFEDPPYWFPKQLRQFTFPPTVHRVPISLHSHKHFLVFNTNHWVWTRSAIKDYLLKRKKLKTWAGEGYRERPRPRAGQSRTWTLGPTAFIQVFPLHHTTLFPSLYGGGYAPMATGHTQASHLFGLVFTLFLFKFKIVSIF